MELPLVIRRILSARELILLVLFVGISLILKGSALIVLTYQTDDYVAFAPTASGWEHFRWMMAQGRFAAAFIICAASQLGIAWPGSSGLFGLLLIIAQVLFAIGVCRLWKSESLLISSLVIGLICFHPYQAELFSFKMGYGFYMPAFFFGALALLIPVKSRAGQIAVCLAIVAAIASFQIILQYLAAALVFALLLDWLREGSLTVSSLWRASAETRSRILALVLAVFLYVLLGFLLSMAFGIPPEGRFKLVAMDDLPDRLRNIYHFLKFLAFRDNLVPLGTRILFLLILAASISAVILSLKRYSLVPFVILILCLLSVLLASVFIPLVIKVWDMNPRTTSALGLWWAAIVFFGCLSRSRLSQFTSGLAILAVLSCAGVTNHVLIDQQRLNLRDEMLANRIVARLEMQSDYEKVQKLVFIGGDRDYELPIKTAQASLNISAFGETWSRLGIFREITGRNFQPGDTANDEHARALFPSMRPWPSVDSVVIQNDLAIIYLPTVVPPQY